jgi:HK97 gp10 family phage protein
MGAFERMGRPPGPAGGFRLVVEDGEALRKLRGLDALTSVKVLRSALRAGGAVIRKRARELAPVSSRRYRGEPPPATRTSGDRDPGDLKRSIGIRTRKAPDGDGWQAIVIVGAWYAHFPEFGVAAHSIKAKRFKAQGRRGRRRRKLHPGHAAKPFLRPAYDEKRDDAIRAFRRRLEKQIAKLTTT